MQLSNSLKKNLAAAMGMGCMRGSEGLQPFYQPLTARFCNYSPSRHAACAYTSSPKFRGASVAFVCMNYLTAAIGSAGTFDRGWVGRVINVSRSPPA